MDDSRRERPAYLAGQWYPSGADACLAAIHGYADVVAQPGVFRGLVGPHAGWSYSGPAAGRGYRQLAGLAGVDLAVVFGSHRAGYGPNTLFRGDGWQTPLGTIPTATEVAAELSAELDLEEEPVFPHAPDNAVELHLPFVRHFFPDARLLMVGVAASAVAISIGEKVGALCKKLARQAVFIGSTDLTHYGPNYGFAPEGYGSEAIAWVRRVNDQGFIDAVLARDAAAALEHGNRNHSACCPGAVAATIAALAAYGHTASPTLVDHYLSCDVHPSNSFVGYASIAL